MESAFRFNDAVIRTLTIKRKEAIIGNSKLYEEELREQERDRERDQRNRAGPEKPAREEAELAADGVQEEVEQTSDEVSSEASETDAAADDTVAVSGEAKAEEVVE